MKHAFAWLCRKVTGKTDAELAAIWQWHYFLTRSRLRAYWLTLAS